MHVVTAGLVAVKHVWEARTEADDVGHAVSNVIFNKCMYALEYFNGFLSL